MKFLRTLQEFMSGHRLMVDDPSKPLGPPGRRDEQQVKRGFDRLNFQRRIWLFLSRDEDHGYRGENERTIQVELDLFKPDIRWVFSVELGPTHMNDGDQARIHFHVALPLLGQVFLSFRGDPIPELEKGHEFEVRLEPPNVSLTLHGNGSGDWRRSDPWWKRGLRVDLLDLFLGREENFSKSRPLGWVDVPMTEGVYRAKVYRVTYSSFRPLWPFVSRHTLYDFKRFVGPSKGSKSIPYPGKGESSWNCGMDGVFGCSFPADGSLQDAIGKVVASVLETRLERTGDASWTPPKRRKSPKKRSAAHGDAAKPSPPSDKPWGVPGEMPASDDFEELQ